MASPFGDVDVWLDMFAVAAGVVVGLELDGIGEARNSYRCCMGFCAEYLRSAA